MRKILLAALLSTIAAPAFAQQPVFCPTRPPGDNTNACASTAFVLANGAGGAVGSVNNFDGTLTISPSTGAVVAAMALGHANTWTALQTFSSGLSTSAATFSGITGVVQCLHVNTSGVISGTGSDCGGSGGTPTLATNHIFVGSGGVATDVAMGGDCTITFVSGTSPITCTKTNGTAFATSATTDTTNAGNISSGTLNTARLPATVTQTIASGALSLSTSAIASATCTSAQTATATGTLTTDVVSASFNGDPTSITGYIPSTSGMLAIIPYPTANTVNFKVCNNTSASITPGTVTINWRVTR